MGYDPKFGQNFLVRPDAGRYILALAPSPDRVFRHMKDAVAILGQDNDVIAGLLQELATPALPTDRLVPRVGWRTRQTTRRRQGEQQQEAPADESTSGGWAGPDARLTSP